MAGRFGGSPLRLRVHGLKEIQRKLRAETLLHPAYRAAMEEAAQAALAEVRKTAPHGATGKLVSRLTYRVQKSDVPRYAVVKTTATRSSPKYRRYSYPRRLEFDPRSKHKDWMLKGLQRAKGKVQSILGDMAKKLESKWSR